MILFESKLQIFPLSEIGTALFMQFFSANKNVRYGSFKFEDFLIAFQSRIWHVLSTVKSAFSILSEYWFFNYVIARSRATKTKVGAS